MEIRERVVIDPAVQHGKPVIKGTRVPVVRIISELAAGTPREQIMAEYDVAPDDIRAALDYAAELVDSDEFHPLPARQQV